jgi:DNA polymerase sigma
MEEYFKIRFNSLSTFYAISNRYDLNKLDLYDNINKEEDTTNFTEYRGDCYINNVTVRMCRNFIDPETPINDDIIDAATWSDYYLADDDINKKKDKYKINRADVNAVQLGHWVTFKVFSNINLALRSLDNSDASEVALMG